MNTTPATPFSQSANVRPFNSSRNHYEFAHHYIRTCHLCSFAEAENDLGWMDGRIIKAAWESQSREFNVQTRFQYLIKKAAQVTSDYERAVKDFGPNHIVTGKREEPMNLWRSVLATFAIEHADELTKAVR